jgi:hypothetical protein
MFLDEILQWIQYEKVTYWYIRNYSFTSYAVLSVLMFCLRPLCPLSTPVACVQYIRTPSSRYSIPRNISYYIYTENIQTVQDNMERRTQHENNKILDTNTQKKVITWHAYAGTEGMRRYSSYHSPSATRRRWVVSTTLWPLWPQERPGKKIALEAGWASRSVRKAQKISRHRDSIPEPHISLMESLYRLVCLRYQISPWKCNSIYVYKWKIEN